MLLQRTMHLTTVAKALSKSETSRSETGLAVLKCQCCQHLHRIAQCSLHVAGKTHQLLVTRSSRKAKDTSGGPWSVSASVHGMPCRSGQPLRISSAVCYMRLMCSSTCMYVNPALIAL